MNRAVGLVAELAVDAGAMDHGSAADERPVDVVVSADRDDLVTGAPKPIGNVSADEPGAAGDRDPHGNSRARPGWDVDGAITMCTVVIATTGASVLPFASKL